MHSLYGAVMLSVAALFAPFSVAAGPEDRLTKGHFPILYSVSDSVITRQEFLELLVEKNEANKSLTATDIAARDAAWQAGDAAILDPVLNNALSEYLADRVEASGGKYAEIVVMDSAGRNVAVSSKTDDYWQGDEAKFIETYALEGNDTYYSGPVFYDDYRKIFAQQIAKPIALRGRRIGAISFEVNIQYTGD